MQREFHDWSVLRICKPGKDCLRPLVLSVALHHHIILPPCPQPTLCLRTTGKKQSSKAGHRRDGSNAPDGELENFARVVMAYHHAIFQIVVLLCLVWHLQCEDNPGAQV